MINLESPEGRAHVVRLVDQALSVQSAVETIKKTGGAVEIAGVRIEPCDDRGQTLTLAAFEDAADARDRVRELAREWNSLPCVCGYRIMDGNDSDSQCLACASVDIFAALGEA